MSAIQTRRVVSGTNFLYYYTTEDLPLWQGMIWLYIPTILILIEASRLESVTNPNQYSQGLNLISMVSAQP